MEKYLTQFMEERNITTGTLKVYRIVLKEYCKLHKLTVKELLEEADHEEEERIRMKHRKIKQRLIKYRQHIINKNLTPNTIKTRMTKIRTFYKHFEIELPTLPPIQLPTSHHERYSDIPNRKDIKKVLDYLNSPKHKAIILFMSSSGTAIAETTKLTLYDFFKACNEELTDNNLYDLIEKLKKEKDLIPLFEMVRLKTNYPYYTCCSPEAAGMILEYLESSIFEYKPTDQLFKINIKSLGTYFNRINHTLGFGKIGSRGFWHSHALRKFHATAIEDIGFANTLQGRRADSITEAYFKHNPKRIKEKYLEHLPKLTINKTIVNKVDDEATKELKKELADTKKELKDVKKSIKDELLAELKNEILS